MPSHAQHWLHDNGSGKGLAQHSLNVYATYYLSTDAWHAGYDGGSVNHHVDPQCGTGAYAVRATWVLIVSMGVGERT